MQINIKAHLICQSSYKLLGIQETRTRQPQRVKRQGPSFGKGQVRLTTVPCIGNLPGRSIKAKARHIRSCFLSPHTGIFPKWSPTGILNINIPPGFDFNTNNNFYYLIHPKEDKFIP
jgi:hypothetical protein